MTLLENFFSELESELFALLSHCFSQLWISAIEDSYLTFILLNLNGWEFVKTVA